MPSASQVPLPALRASLVLLAWKLREVIVPESSAAEHIHELAERLAEFRVLAQREPAQYLPKVAGVCNNLGNLLADQGRYEDAGAHLAEALVLHMMLWLGDRGAHGPNLGIVLASVRDLAANPEFESRREWLAKLWGVVLYNLHGNCFPFCRELGGLFESLEQWELALEPYIFAELILKEQSPEQAARARADAQRLEDKLDQDLERLRSGIEERLLPFTSVPSRPAPR